MAQRSMLFVGLAVLAGCSPTDRREASPTETATPAPLVATTSPAASDPAADWVAAAYSDEDALMYKAGSVDLDGDGTDELLVYPAGPMLCGSGGCNLVVLQKSGDAWSKISELTVTQLPVGVLDTRTNGWSDLWVTVAGGGLPAATMKLTFDGKSYPSNPTVAPAVAIEEPGKVVIVDGEFTRIR